MIATKLGSGRAALMVIEFDYANAQNVSFTATPGESTAIASECVRVTATQDCWYITGTTFASPALSVGDGAFLPYGMVELVALKPGQKIAVIAANNSGSLNIVPAVMR